VLAAHLTHLLAEYGYLAIIVVVGLENVGLPVPGETILITAAIYAGTSHELRLPFIVVAAAVASAVGGAAGYAIGRRGGHPLVERYGSYFHIDDAKLRLGQYLFVKYGGTIVFLGRFVAVLRPLAGFLAGLNRMDARRFLIFNALGSVLWATVFGLGGYVLGERLERASTWLAIGLGIAALAGIVIGIAFIRRHQQQFQLQADRALRIR
jgi:membrane protein DedA with SNARE-associated domain